MKVGRRKAGKVGRRKSVGKEEEHLDVVVRSLSVTMVVNQ